MPHLISNPGSRQSHPLYRNNCNCCHHNMKNIDGAYKTDMEKSPEGVWPPMPKINNIVFLDSQQEGDAEEFSETKICTELKVYGGPDMMRHRYCPVYYYWAGAVLSTLKPGVYNYRFVLELEQEGKKEKLYLHTQEKPSLKVIDLSAGQY